MSQNQPGKKRTIWVVIIAILLALACCCCLAGVLGFSFSSEIETFFNDVFSSMDEGERDLADDEDLEEEEDDILAGTPFVWDDDVEVTNTPEPAVEVPTAEEPETFGGTLNVWSFTNEALTLCIAYEGTHPGVDIQFTMIPMTDGEYQARLLTSIYSADAPDVIFMEYAFIRDWVEADDILENLNDMLPYADAIDTYQYVLDVATYNGVTKAYSYQATPGAVFYRRSLALQYFGTDDPTDIQNMMSDMEGFTEMAATLKAASGGSVYMIASPDEFILPYYYQRSQPWIVNNTLMIDPALDDLVSYSKLFRDKNYEAGYNQWYSEWFSGMNDDLINSSGNPQHIFCYFLPTWGLPFVLAPNSYSYSGGEGTYGDWAMVPGPLPYFWGGTWLGVVKGTDNLELAKDFIRFVALDEETLANWATGVYTNDYLRAVDPTISSDQAQFAGDFTSSQKVTEEIISSFDNNDLSTFLGGQNSYEIFADSVLHINGDLIQTNDSAIQSAFSSALYDYLDGNVGLNQMWVNFKNSVSDIIPGVSTP